MRKHRLKQHLWLIALVAVAIVVSLPILTVLVQLFEPTGPTWQHLKENVLLSYIANTFYLLLGVGLLSLVFGISSAWFVSNYAFPGRKFFEWGLVLPMSIPTYIVAYTYAGIFDYTGPIQFLFRDVLNLDLPHQFFNILNTRGVIFILAFVLYPYIYVICRSAFVQQSSGILEVSRVLGSPPIRTFFKVALPIARPAIIAGLSLVLMEVLNDYGAVKYFGVSTFTTGIFRAWFSLGDEHAAIYLSAILLVFVAILIFTEKVQRGKARFSDESSSQKPINRFKLKGWKAAFASTLCGIPFAFGFFFPMVQLIYWCFLTFGDVVNKDFFHMVWNSFLLSTVTAFIAVIVATFLVYAARTHGSFIAKLFVRISTLGYAIPGAVIAVGVLIPFLALENWFNDFFNLNLTYSILNTTTAVLIFAYMVRFLAVGHNPVEAAFKRLPTTYDEAGAVLGASKRRIFTKIIFPNINKSMVAGFMLVFVDTLKELPLTLILRPFNFNTLATKAFELAGDEMLAESANASIIIVLTGILPVLLLSKFMSGKEKV